MLDTKVENSLTPYKTEICYFHQYLIEYTLNHLSLSAH